ncbi:MAG: hypothetical protein AUH85_14365 [Chloroflexi bacterium 13_1_40CM_4_68_4]|nr:MAG: hypothetical protein AUH85_14365 [Chloroflexi bacterium 13_1_40CM_4_68_4]
MAGSIESFFAGEGILYAVLVLAEIVAVALLISARRRRARFAAAHASTEPLDLLTLRARMRIVEPVERSGQLPLTRELLADLRRQKAEAGFGGVAGSSRRR